MSADAVIVGVGSARKVQIWLLIGSGVVAAAQIGKAIISMLMIRTDMALGRDLAGLIVATFATLGAFFGLGAGVLVRRSGVRRSLIVGMGAITIGNLIGAAAPNEFALLIAHRRSCRLLCYGTRNAEHARADCHWRGARLCNGDVERLCRPESC